jgi:hypothetical protein
LKQLYEVNSQDLNVQARYLDVLVDVDFTAARELQSKLRGQAVEEDEDLILRLLDEGMP